MSRRLDKSIRSSFEMDFSDPCSMLQVVVYFTIIMVAYPIFLIIVECASRLEKLRIHILISSRDGPAQPKPSK
jgi:hypothetical protein